MINGRQLRADAGTLAIALCAIASVILVPERIQVKTPAAKITDTTDKSAGRMRGDAFFLYLDQREVRGDRDREGAHEQQRQGEDAHHEPSHQRRCQHEIEHGQLGAPFAGARLRRIENERPGALVRPEDPAVAIYLGRAQIAARTLEARMLYTAT
jgi:hypothetical protein